MYFFFSFFLCLVFSLNVSPDRTHPTMFLMLHLCFLKVAPKPLTSTGVVNTTQTQQRLIMPATPLPQIQPNFTNLPSAVLAPAHGGGNVGYTVLPAQYVTQVQSLPSSFVPLCLLTCRQLLVTNVFPCQSNPMACSCHSRSL